MAKRRPKGSGTLRQRGRRWCAEIRLETATGKVTARNSFRTKRAAEAWLKGMSEREGPYESDPTQPLTPLVDKWLKSHAIKIEPNTFRHYNYFVGLMKPATDALTIATSTPIRVEECVAALPLTTYQKKRVYQVLRQFFQWCVRMGEIATNPMSVLDLPKHETKKPLPWRPSECRAFIDAAKDSPYHSLLVVMLTTGIRPGEAFALQWEDVDLEKGTILIRQSLEDIDGKLRLKIPKTKASTRTLLLPKIAREAMEKHALKPGRIGHVWKSAWGKPLRRSRFRDDVLRPLFTAAGVPPIRAYDFRHSAITVMLLTTKDLKRTSATAGHATTKQTIDTYAHLLDLHDDEFTALVDGAFREKSADCGQKDVHSENKPEPPRDVKDDDDDASGGAVLK